MMASSMVGTTNNLSGDRDTQRGLLGLDKRAQTHCLATVSHLRVIRIHVTPAEYT